MKLDFFLQPGSPSFIFSPPDLLGRGVGGAEYGLISLTEQLAAMGHTVTVYNSSEDAEYNGVSYRDAYTFDPFSERDILVLFRNPMEPPEQIAYAFGKRVFWSCDQRTAGNYDTDVFPFIDHTVTISQYHKDYFLNVYNDLTPERITPLDLGVRLGDYQQKKNKVKNRLLYCSVPSRGLQYLAQYFKAIRHFFDDAELYITSDFSLWGAGIGANNEQYRQMFQGMRGVHFLGKVPREQLVDLQLTSDLLVYPNAPSEGAFPELFGVSVAECQVAGCVPVTSKFGGLATTVHPEYGKFILDNSGEPLHPQDPEYGTLFVESVTQLLQNRKRLEQRQELLRSASTVRFNWVDIAKLWESLFSKVLSKSQ